MKDPFDKTQQFEHRERATPEQTPMVSASEPPGFLSNMHTAFELDTSLGQAMQWTGTWFAAEEFERRERAEN